MCANRLKYNAQWKIPNFIKIHVFFTFFIVFWNLSKTITFSMVFEWLHKKNTFFPSILTILLPKIMKNHWFSMFFEKSKKSQKSMFFSICYCIFKSIKNHYFFNGFCIFAYEKNVFLFNFYTICVENDENPLFFQCFLNIPKNAIFFAFFIQFVKIWLPLDDPNGWLRAINIGKRNQKSKTINKNNKQNPSKESYSKLEKHEQKMLSKSINTSKNHKKKT